MLKWLICLCLAFPAGVLADAPSIQRPVPTATPPHLCMMDYPESAVWDGAEGTTIVAFRIAGIPKNVLIDWRNDLGPAK